MTEPQTWTIIGVLTAAFFGMMSVFMRSFTGQMGSLRNEMVSGSESLRNEMVSLRNEMVSGSESLRNEMVSLRNEMINGFESVRTELRSEIGSVRSELKSEIGGLRVEMNARFEVVDRRFETVSVRLDNLQRDVQPLVERVFGADRP